MRLRRVNSLVHKLFDFAGVQELEAGERQGVTAGKFFGGGK